MEVSGLVGVSPLFVLGNGKGERGVEHGVHHVNEWHVGNYGAEQVRTHVDDCAHRSEEHTSELQSSCKLVCRLLLEKTFVETRVYRSARTIFGCFCAPPGTLTA